MTLEELEQAFQNLSADSIEQATEVAAQEAIQQPDSYLTFDNVDRDFGNWYKHDKDIGSILMEQLKANGVDTRDATEAALREVLTDIVGRLEILTDTFSNFKAEVDSLKNQAQQVTNAVEDTLHAAGATVTPPVDTTMPMTPDMESMSPLPEDTGTVPVGGSEELPPLPEGMGITKLAPEPEMAPVGTPSDARVKNIKAKVIEKRTQQKPVVVSDAKMKKVEGTAINPAFVSICNWR